MILIFFLTLLLFCLNYVIERRNLLIGLTFIGMLLGLMFPLMRLLVTFENNYFVYLLILFIAIVLALFLLSGPLLFIALCLYNGTKLLRREGIRWTNFLSLGLGFGILAYLFILPLVLEKFQGITWFNILYVYLGGLLAYLLVLSALYTVSSILNLIHLSRKPLDFIVVLGAGLMGDRVTPLLAGRLDKGIELLRKNPGSKLIVSGGQGPDELVSEAEAMANYAKEQGVVESDLILENQSRNTYENLTFSHALMPENSHFALVTNYYHVFRALLLAKSQGIQCIGYGSKTKFYFTLNAFIREFVGYMVFTRKRHLVFLGLYTLLYIGLFLVEQFVQN